MEEILNFVCFELKKVGLDARTLLGGLIITGGGSQLKHLIQLSEYTTGLNARIGLPNEHLAPNHLEELKKPMYSTCIGLILKGFNDYDNQVKRFNDANPVKIEKKAKVVEIAEPEAVIEELPIEETTKKGKKKEVESAPKPIEKSKFWDKFKGSIIDLFQEEEDKIIK